MSSCISSIVTASGASEPQRPAGVGGSGVKTGTNVAGPLRSSSSDREGTGVDDQAPATLYITGAKLMNCGPRRRQRATWSPEVILASTAVEKSHVTTRDRHSQTEWNFEKVGRRDFGTQTTSKFSHIEVQTTVGSTRTEIFPPAPCSVIPIAVPSPEATKEPEAIFASSMDVIEKREALTTCLESLPNSSTKQESQSTETLLIKIEREVPYAVESIDEVIVSLMASPVTYTEEGEDNYKKELLIAITGLHEINLRSRFLKVKYLLNSYERMAWFASVLLKYILSNQRLIHGVYSRMMQDIGSDLFNSIILSETYRTIRLMLKNKDPADNKTLSILSDWLGIITTTFKKCKPTKEEDIQLVKKQVVAYEINGHYMYYM